VVPGSSCPVLDEGVRCGCVLPACWDHPTLCFPPIFLHSLGNKTRGQSRRKGWAFQPLRPCPKDSETSGAKYTVPWTCLSVSAIWRFPTTLRQRNLLQLTSAEAFPPELISPKRVFVPYNHPSQ